MKIAFALLVVYCVCVTDATLKHLKAKLKLSPIVQPATYRYVPSPVPVPVVYSSPVSTYTTHTSTYVPHYASSYSVYKAPTPVVYKSPIAVPVAVYRKPVAIYEEPIVYEEPESVTLEASGLGGHVIESHYTTYGQIWDK